MKRRSLCAALFVMVAAGGLLFSLGTVAQAAKDRVVVAFGSNIPTLDPHMHSSRLAHIADYHLYDTLMYRSPKDNYKPGPGLATSIKSLNPAQGAQPDGAERCTRRRAALRR